MSSYSRPSTVIELHPDNRQRDPILVEDLRLVYETFGGKRNLSRFSRCHFAVNEGWLTNARDILRASFTYSVTSSVRSETIQKYGNWKLLIRFTISGELNQ